MISSFLLSRPKQAYCLSSSMPLRPMHASCDEVHRHVWFLQAKPPSSWLSWDSFRHINQTYQSVCASWVTFGPISGMANIYIQEKDRLIRTLCAKAWAWNLETQGKIEHTILLLSYPPTLVTRKCWLDLSRLTSGIFFPVNSPSGEPLYLQISSACWRKKKLRIRNMHGYVDFESASSKGKQAYMQKAPG